MQHRRLGWAHSQWQPHFATRHPCCLLLTNCIIHKGNLPRDFFRINRLDGWDPCYYVSYTYVHNLNPTNLNAGPKWNRTNLRFMFSYNWCHVNPAWTPNNAEESYCDTVMYEVTEYHTYIWYVGMKQGWITWGSSNLKPLHWATLPLQLFNLLGLVVGSKQRKRK